MASTLGRLRNNLRGFGGDTMHMARLFNPSMGPKSYSLAGLTKTFEKQIIKEKLNLLKFLDQIQDKKALNQYK